MLLTDFPVALLQPIFRAMPALAHAAPAASAAGAPVCYHACQTVYCWLRWSDIMAITPYTMHCLHQSVS